MFENIINLIKKYPKIIIHRHEKPDGDAMGSQIGLYHIIKDTWPDKTVLCVGDTSPRYAFIAGREMDVIEDSEYKGHLR
jgi:phosphoesterase RecJ-like protein